MIKSIVPYRLFAALIVSAALAFASSTPAAAQADPTMPTPDAEATPRGIAATLVQTAPVRAQPDARAAILGRYTAGDPVIVTARDADARWLYVESASEAVMLTGWLPAFTLTLIGDPADLPEDLPAQVPSATPAGTPAPVTVAAVGRVNIRREPRIGDNVIGQLNGGETARATARSSQDNDWLLIESGARSGWVAYFAVRVAGDPSALPVLIPDAAPDGDTLIPPSIQITTRFNARMREMPSLESAVWVIVPFGAPITPLGRTRAGDWVLARYDGLEGWIDAALLEATAAQIAALPVME